MIESKVANPETIVAPEPVTAPSSPEQRELHRLKVGALLVEQAGKFVSLDFVKADGSKRTLTGRLGVRKHLAGGDRTVGNAEHACMVVYDVFCRGYRAVNLSTVQRVRAQHTEFQVVG